MIKEEFSKVLSSNRSKAIFAYLMLVALLDNIFGIYYSKKGIGYINPHPTFMSLLSGKAGITFYAMFVWILSITLMILYCDKYAQEKNGGIKSIYILKTSRNKLFWSKMLVSFLLPILFCGIPLATNLLIDIIFLNGGTSFSDLEMYTVEEVGSFLVFCVHNPYVAWLGYYLASALIFGLLGVMCQSFSMVIEDVRVAYVITFAIWISFFCFRFNIPKIIQPYTEYGPTDALQSFCVFIPFVMIPLGYAFYCQVIKKDEY